MINLFDIRKKLKGNARVAAIFVTLRSLKDEKACKRIAGVDYSPDIITVQHLGQLNPDKWVYCVKCDEGYEYNGFCSLYKLTLLYLAYANDRLMTPVVYWGEKSMAYDPTVTECDNAFEYYFKQVSEVDYAQANQSKHVVFSRWADATAFQEISSYEFLSDADIALLVNAQKKYISLAEPVKALFWDELQTIISGGKTLGVHVRATDYNQGFNRHPVVVTPQEYLEAAKTAVAEQGFEKVFLATDDEPTVALFREAFGDRLHFYQDTYRSSNGKAIHYGEQTIQREHHRFVLGLEILKDFYTLGHCDGLIAGRSNVSACARIIKASTGGQYRMLNLIDKGVNHNNKETRSKAFNMFKKS